MLRAYRDYRELCDEMHYWAPAGRSTVAVHFLLIRGPDLAAVEVKSGGAFRKDWCRGLRAVAQLPGPRRRVVVYPKGPALRTGDGIDILSVVWALMTGKLRIEGDPRPISLFFERCLPG